MGGVGRVEGEEKENLRNRIVKWRKDRDKSKERDILIEEAIMGLARNLALEKFLGIHNNYPS